jgi:hypothetical protein
VKRAGDEKKRKRGWGEREYVIMLAEGGRGAGVAALRSVPSGGQTTRSEDLNIAR